MVTRRSGSFPGSEGNILSPRSSETSGLGVKMVEYVLGTSPTSKELEPRMRALVMVSIYIYNSKLISMFLRRSQALTVVLTNIYPSIFNNTMSP